MRVFDGEGLCGGMTAAGMRGDRGRKKKRDTDVKPIICSIWFLLPKFKATPSKRVMTLTEAQRNTQEMCEKEKVMCVSVAHF